MRIDEWALKNPTSACLSKTLQIIDIYVFDALKFQHARIDELKRGQDEGKMIKQFSNLAMSAVLLVSQAGLGNAKNFSWPNVPSSQCNWHTITAQGDHGVWGQSNEMKILIGAHPENCEVTLPTPLHPSTKIKITTKAKHGMVAYNRSGESFKYVAQPGFTGEDDFDLAFIAADDGSRADFHVRVTVGN